jgi:hypothetical protein
MIREVFEEENSSVENSEMSKAQRMTGNQDLRNERIESVGQEESSGISLECKDCSQHPGVHTAEWRDWFERTPSRPDWGGSGAKACN